MGPTWVLIAVVMSLLELSGVFGYVPEPLTTYRPKKSFAVERDDSAIYFPESETDDDSRYHTGSKRSLSVSDNAPARFSDLYPQTSFFNAERPARDQPAAHGPQNGWGNPPPQWGNPGFNKPPRQPNRPNWGGGGNQPWGGSGGNFNRPASNDYDESPFVFDRPPPNGGGRPQPGNGGVARPQQGNGGVARPQPGSGGVTRPQPGQQRPGNNGGGGRPRPSTRPTVTPATTTPRAAAATTRPAPGAPVTVPTPAPTRAGCNCPSTPEFNPVCGQDRVTYTNPGKLRCANACGNNVMMLHFGSCVTTTTPPPSR